MPGLSGDLEGAIDTYSRALFQLWCLPWNVWQAVKGSGTLQSTQFSSDVVPPGGSRHRLTLSKPLAPGIPYTTQNEALPASAIRFSPPVLKSGDPTFRLLIEGHALHHLPGATYWGEVTVVDDEGGQPVGAPVTVWLVVS
jgi:hypothetical protein